MSFDFVSEVSRMYRPLPRYYRQDGRKLLGFDEICDPTLHNTVALSDKVQERINKAVKCPVQFIHDTSRILIEL